jgi:outer membrane protein assembly factor BamB
VELHDGRLYLLPLARTDGVVYVGSHDNKVYAPDTRTGDKLWDYVTNGIVNSSPSVADCVVCVGSEDNNVYALDAKTGAYLWSYTTHDPIDPRLQ